MCKKLKAHAVIVMLQGLQLALFVELKWKEISQTCRVSWVWLYLRKYIHANRCTKVFILFFLKLPF